MAIKHIQNVSATGLRKKKNNVYAGLTNFASLVVLFPVVRFLIESHCKINREFVTCLMEKATTARLKVVHFPIRQVTFSVNFSIVLDKLFLCPVGVSGNDIEFSLLVRINPA